MVWSREKEELEHQAAGQLVPAEQLGLAKSFGTSTMQDIFRPGPEAFTPSGKLRRVWKEWVLKQVEVAFSRIELEAQTSRVEEMSNRARRLI